MLKKFINWFFSPRSKLIVEDIDVYSQLLELEEKYKTLLLDLRVLEEENIETTNTLYEIMNSMNAIDARIDILAIENWNNKNND